VLWIGLALGTFLAVEALTHGVMLPGLNGFLAAVLTFVLLLAAGVALAELARRHRRTVAGYAIRHGKRGAAATARHARRHGGTARTWLVSRARSRWENREHGPLIFRKLRGEPDGPAAEPAPGTEAPAPGAAPPCTT
jgi:hypothetical protein